MLHALKAAVSRFLNPTEHAKTQGVPRDPRWPAVRRAFLKDHPECAACGGTKGVQLHHVYPFSWPGGHATELEPSNFLPLCEHPPHNCHLLIGHSGDFKSRNEGVRKDAARMLDKIRNRPYPPKK